jgi:nucleotide-binding universal stress UspA family protein
MSDEGFLVVGVDASDAGQLALAWTLREARQRGSAVEVVTAWTSARDSRDHHESAAEQIREKAITAALASAGVPAPCIFCEVFEADPITASVHASERAALLVIGSDRHARLKSSLFGSVIQEIIHRATCPVVVIPVSNPADEPPLAGKPLPSVERHRIDLELPESW